MGPAYARRVFSITSGEGAGPGRRYRWEEPLFEARQNIHADSSDGRSA